MRQSRSENSEPLTQVQQAPANPDSFTTNNSDSIQNGIHQGLQIGQNIHDEIATSDKINWVQINPSTVPYGYTGPISWSVNLIGDPKRVGTVFIQGVDPGYAAATVFANSVRYEAGQNMVSGELRVVTYHRGTIEVRAKVINQNGQNTEATTTLTIN